MTQKHTLAAESRSIVGRKVKQMRKQDILPANIFGSKVTSISIQLSSPEFLKLYKEVGDTGLIELTIKGEKANRPVLVHKLHAHPVNGLLIHADFRQVDL